MTNLARFVKADAEAALRGTNAKFTRRFEYIEDALAATGRTVQDASLEEMEALWKRSEGRKGARMKTILITGASSGIGKATAQRLAEGGGVRLILAARRRDKLEELAASLPC